MITTNPCPMAVHADADRAHGRGVEQPDARQHHCVWQHRPVPQGLERGDGGVCVHALRAHLYRALSAPAREYVSMINRRDNSIVNIFSYILNLSEEIFNPQLMLEYVSTQETKCKSLSKDK